MVDAYSYSLALRLRYTSSIDLDHTQSDGNGENEQQQDDQAAVVKIEEGSRRQTQKQEQGKECTEAADDHDLPGAELAPFGGHLVIRAVECFGTGGELVIRRERGKNKQQSQQNHQKDEQAGGIGFIDPLLQAGKTDKRGKGKQNQRKKVEVHDAAEARHGCAQLPEYDERENADRERHHTQYNAERRDLVAELEGVVQKIDDGIGDAEAEEVLEPLVQQRRVGPLAQGDDRRCERGSDSALCGDGNGNGGGFGDGCQGLVSELFSIMAVLLSCSLAFYFSLNLKYGHAHWKRYPCAVREAR